LGHDVVPLDNFRNGYRENLVRGNELFHNIIEADIRDSELVSKIPKGIDSIIHLAAITSLPECESLPLESVSINVQGTANILELARKIDCEHVIFSSTSAIYENNQEEIFTEDLQTNPHLWYCLSKKLSEEICQSYEKKYGLNITIARLFNVFGPHQDIHRPNPPLINYIVREVAAGRIPTLHGDGNQSRDYIHVDDVVNFISKALTIKPHGIFNVCSGELRSVNDIYKLITDALDSNINPKFREASKLWNTYPQLCKFSFARS
jgi:nucleoside-diphosphate-sugar epimerase